MDEIIKKIKKARFIFICGNGGSATTAEHFSIDLVKKGYRAICLNSNTALITMLANDYSYDQIFLKQLELYATNGDLLITISCSGISPNIKAAQEFPNWVAFETFGEETDYGKLEDKHLKFAHEVAARL